jgi:hypothetical protein
MWRATYNGPVDLAAFEDVRAKAALAPAVVTRKAHFAALFSILPTVVERSLCGSTGTGTLHPVVRAMADAFPPSSLAELDNSLGTLFERIFRLADENAGAFSDL